MRIEVNKATKGMVLQKDIYTDIGELVLVAGTVLSEFFIEKLIDKNVASIEVLKDMSTLEDNPVIAEEERVEQRYQEAVDRFKKLFDEFKLGNQVVYKEVEDVTLPIIDEVLHNSSIARHLWKLKHANDYTFHHSVNVSIVSSLLAKWLNFSESIIRRAAIAGLMHDIGKSEIPAEILNKTERLTDAEYEIMQQHPIHGYNMLKDNSDMPDNVLDAVLHHHERLDGKGYPHQLSGDAIQSLTRIIAIADAYSSMTNHPIYTDALNPYKAAQVLRDSAYHSLDPTYTQVFISGISNYYVGNIVKLTSGQIGEVIMVNNAELDRPLIKCKDNFVDLSKDRTLEIEKIIY